MKGYVRTYVLHQHLLEHLPPPPATVLDVGGGAGHQSFPLAQAGYEVTVLDSSPAMLDKARLRLDRLPADVRERVAFGPATVSGPRRRWADGASTRCCATACSGTWTGRSRWSASCAGAPPRRCGLDHDRQRQRGCRAPGTGTPVGDALAAFDSRTEIGVLGVQGRADTVEELSELIRSEGVAKLKRRTK